MLNQLLQLFRNLKKHLNVSIEDISHNLLLAPLYTALVAYPLLCAYFFFIIEYPTTELFKLIVSVLLFLVIVFLVYLTFVYVFAHLSQTFLLRKKCLNFYTTLASAFVILALYSTLLTWNLSDIGLSVLFFSLFAVPIVITYWVLLFRAHQKNSK